MPSTIAAFKLVGTVSLGLFTGVSYSLGALSIPSLLALPSAKPAQHVFTSLQQSAALHLRSLGAVSFLSLNLAYFLSPSRARHPYLLWTALLAGAATGADLLFGRSALDLDQDANGETVERAVRASQRIEQARTAVGLVGFAMGLVGIWGDGA